jgi:hypothetical protein
METLFTWQTGLVLVAFLLLFRPLGKLFLKLLPKQPPAPPKPEEPEEPIGPGSWDK